MPKSIVSLNLGFSDAQNYTQRGNKQMLSEVFVKNSYNLVCIVTTTKTKITCFQKGEKLLALYTCFFALLLLALSITNFYCMNFSFFILFQFKYMIFIPDYQDKVC